MARVFPRQPHPPVTAATTPALGGGGRSLGEELDDVVESREVAVGEDLVVDLGPYLEGGLHPVVVDVQQRQRMVTLRATKEQQHDNLKTRIPRRLS